MSENSLTNLRVLEFTHAILGPSCGIVLADMGAEVIKIEPLDGDHTRTLKGFGAGYFPMFNRNKKSLAINIKSAEGRQIIYDLVKTADVVIENFAPNTMERLGFGYDTLAQLNPRLIYCTLKGFLPGPYEHRSALDEVVQMMAGLAYMTGPEGMPLRAGASITDILGGTFGALGILVALRDRDHTGTGQLVRNGLYETAAYLMGQHMVYSAVLGEPIPPMPGRKRSWAVYQPFATREGDLVFVGITSDKHWKRFCEVFNRPDLWADATLATNDQRYDEFERLTADLTSLFATMSKADLLAKCEQAEIPFAPVNRPEDLLEDEHLNATGNLLNIQVAPDVLCKLPRLPISIGEQDYGLHRQPPQVGEHTHEILSTAGYTPDQIQAWLNAHVIA